MEEMQGYLLGHDSTLPKDTSAWGVSEIVPDELEGCVCGAPLLRYFSNRQPASEWRECCGRIYIFDGVYIHLAYDVEDGERVCIRRAKQPDQAKVLRWWEQRLSADILSPLPFVEDPGQLELQCSS